VLVGTIGGLVYLRLPSTTRRLPEPAPAPPWVPA
jgi:hypothetical protein